MQLNPRQIEAFRTVMLTGSMTAAAERLKVTQPAVSRLIRDLEAELDLRLFRREGNRLVPNHEATILFADVDRFYVGLDRVAKTANELRHANVGALRIASIGALSLSCITHAISILHTAHPAVDISLESLNTPQTLDLVAGRHFDIGFAQAVAEFPGVRLTQMPSVETVCVMPSTYPIASRDFIEPRDLEGLPFISLGRNNPQRLKIDQLFDDLNVRRQMLLETSLAASAIGLVESGLGVSIVDPFTATYLSGRNVVTRPFKSNFCFDIVAVQPIHHQQSKLCKEFIQIMIDLFKKQASSREK
ncbi:hypothetical protein ASE61_25065 [Bosea sp. Root670]|jgi:DNA-binding transcriptional LysR family regulator|uniref:DNA-binding transcriptional regulator, LysR family n=1 Tax=Bosea robiniae TaxID=1036780 RepID=A0ABY0P2B7_9HYPH|nr:MULTISPECIES: LysR substrate-binding domain-containing protein [Bosea]KRE06248.1 hypothetical protein ASE61_25065 [Bosea sp. Root670]TQI75297.1 DNA-binding transcriptional LysR family regulator [Bosea sp. AK1]SDG84292.1 DNA-binding transcriptional regulator, LysR family [Bosea robiniae]